MPMMPEHKEQKLNYYITADLAISESEKADFSVFLVAAVDEYKRIFVVNVVRDKLDGREIVDTILALHRTYNPEIIGIEEMQVFKAIGSILVLVTGYPAVLYISDNLRLLSAVQLVNLLFAKIFLFHVF